MKTFHVWMPDGRSLCDRRALLRGPDVLTLTDDEFDEWVDEQTKSPACGSCLLLAQHLQHEAATIYEAQGGRVHPHEPVQGWEEVQSTRWGAKINLPEFLATEGLAAQLKYERIKEGIAEHRLKEWVADRKAGDEERLRLIRERRTEGAPESDTT